MIRFLLAILVGKCVLVATHVLSKTGGSAAPGLLALKIDPQLISKLASQIDTNIVITGTNGKTTTSAMMAQILKDSKKVIHNNTGSNLSRGIASKLLAASSITGSISAGVGIWEADEAAFVDIVEKVKPQHIVILNIARDQLDRYGEINTILKKWKKALEKASWKKTVYLNADDGNVYELRKTDNAAIRTFGITDSPVQFEKASKDPRHDIKAKVLESTMHGIEFVFVTSEVTKFTTLGVTPKVVGQRLRLPIAGAYNVYNFLAAYLVSSHLGVSVENIVSALTSFTPAFGRMERVMFGKTEGLITLIKNPAGATQVIHTIAPMMKKEDVLVIMLNDNIADGTDVSWIWDTDFEELAPRLNTVHITGMRRFDMALRLKYAGVEKEKIVIKESINEILSHASGSLQDDNSRIFILPTYTALLELQRYLKEKGYKEKHWHE